MKSILKIFFFAWFISILLSLNAQPNAQLIYMPKSRNTNIIHNTYYSLSYRTDHKQPEWVYYKIHIGNTKRINRFYEDKRVKGATLDDYKNSGYDRGHLAPAKSMSINPIAMRECFLLSNISPQDPHFNRGKWRQLEEFLRKLSLSDDSLHIVTGPIFSTSPKKIGKGKISVPKYFYKIVYSEKHQKMLAFVLENKKITQSLTYYIVTVDFIEQQTHIDFFPQLDDDLHIFRSLYRTLKKPILRKAEIYFK